MGKDCRRLHVIILLLPVLLLASCSGKKEVSAPKEEEHADDTAQKMEGFSMEGFTKGGGKKWEVAGASAEIKGDKIEMEDVAGNIYDKEGKVTITAKEGSYIQSEESVHLEKDVVVTTADGAKLNTESLDWSGKNEVVSTDKDVTVTKDNIEIEGNALTGEPQLNQVKLEKDVTVKVAPSSTVTCSGPLEVDYKNNVAYFHKDVILQDERGKVFADEAEVFFNPDTKAITRVIATGNVRIIQGENVTYSQKAEYLADEGKVILSGEPKLTIYSKGEAGNAPFGN
jgi:LPS export ABC transporter protein LptC